MKTNLLPVLALFTSLILPATAGAQNREEIPFVPTPLEVVDKMLELAELKKGDLLYDLGSGDGRIVIRAAGAGREGVGHSIALFRGPCLRGRH